MPIHKFVHTVSGVELTEAQKGRIYEEIAATVTRVLLGMTPSTLTSNYLAEHPVCGGAHKREENEPQDSLSDVPASSASRQIDEAGLPLDASSDPERGGSA